MSRNWGSMWSGKGLDTGKDISFRLTGALIPEKLTIISGVKAGWYRGVPTAASRTSTVTATVTATATTITTMVVARGVLPGQRRRRRGKHPLAWGDTRRRREQLTPNYT